MAATAVATTRPKYLAISFIGAGSSWLHGDDIDDLVTRLRKKVRRDWSDYYEFKTDPVVNVFDKSEAEDWYATYDGVFNNATNEKLPLLEVRK